MVKYYLEMVYVRLWQLRYLLLNPINLYTSSVVYVCPLSRLYNRNDRYKGQAKSSLTTSTHKKSFAGLWNTRPKLAFLPYRPSGVARINDNQTSAFRYITYLLHVDIASSAYSWFDFSILNKNTPEPSVTPSIHYL